MICPGCGFEVDEGLLTCPYCDADLTQTSPLHATGASWCAECGALLGKDDAVCPSCGTPCPQAPTVAPAAKRGEGTPVARTELTSAIPDDGDDVTSGNSPAPIFRYVATIAAGACALVALVLFVWQPWIPRDNVPARIEPTPSQNTPQVINALSGQDFRESTATRLGERGSRTTIEWAHDGYEIMIGLAARLKSNWALLTQVADGTITQGLDLGRDEAASIVSEVRTLYEDVAGAPEDEGYLVEVGRLMNLIEWLDTSSEGVLDGWDAAMATDENARGEAIVDALGQAGVDGASSEFVAHYEEWEPKE